MIATLEQLLQAPPAPEDPIEPDAVSDVNED
jgi:hypothetical protein